MKRAFVVLVAASVVSASMLAALLLILQPPDFGVPAARDWVFRDVVLVEAGRAPTAVRALRIQGRKIAAIEDVPSQASAPGSSPEVEFDAHDLQGLYVTPGLSDLHVHYPPRIAIGNAELWSLLLLAHGVTSIRETGSIDGSIFEVREAIRAGRFPGPRIYACGEVLDGDPPVFPSNHVLTAPKQARDVVLRLAARGADCIKAYNMLSPEVLAAIREAAAHAGLPVIGHAPHSVRLEDAGLADLQHGTGAVVVDRERVGRMDFRYEDWLTVDDARIAHVSAVSLEQDIAHTPTLVNARMRRLLADRQLADEAMSRDSGLRHLPHFWVPAWRALWNAPFTRGDPDSEAIEALFQTRQAGMTAGLHGAGVRIHAGTDTLMPFVAPGSSLHGEIEELVAAGIAPEDVFEIATREAGRSLGIPLLGTLEVGAPADLIFLAADPTHDVTAFSRIEAVLADGRLYRRAELEAMLAAADAHFHGAVYAGVMNGLASLMQGQFAPEP